MFLNKKAISETTSFIFLTLIIVVFSSIAYFFLSDQLDQNRVLIDRNNMENNLKKFDFVIRNIISIDNNTVSFPVSYKTGSLSFQGNQISYQSQLRYETLTPNCFDSVCYVGFNNFERIYFNITTPYSFSDNFTLNSGDYILIFSHIKNENKIKVSTR